jgi:hypothetical protein
MPSEAVRMPTGFGPNSGFFLMIDTKQRLHPRTQPQEPICRLKPSNNFIISVSNTDSAFDKVRHSVKIKPGYKTVIRLIPSQVVATPALHDLSQGDRKCKEPNENENWLLILDTPEHVDSEKLNRPTFFKT